MGRRGAITRAARLLAAVALASAGTADAWVYPEHRDITVLAVEKLDPTRRSELEGLWREARVAHEARLCDLAADAAQGQRPSCLDWAALPALAGDHSCSSRELTGSVLESRWVLPVAAVAARLKAALARIEIVPPAGQVSGTEPAADVRRVEAESARAARINALRTADTDLQRADALYATRAGTNNAHFLLARPRTGITSQEYAALALREGSDVNAVGTYAWFHLSALQKASRLAHEPIAPEARRDVVRAMLFDEAFAIHFLEDTFAAGHVAGSWGDASQRKGTHDYYNEAGLEAFSWESGSKSMVLMGDAHLRAEDAERTAAAVATSLEELLDTVVARPRAADHPPNPGASLDPDPFDVCRNTRFPTRPEPRPAAPEAYWSAFAVELGEVLLATPIPGLGPGLGAMPRFRSEVGPFVGLSGIIDGRGLTGAFTSTEGAGFMGGVELSVRVGVGLEGVMGDAGDGLVFLAAGLRGDSPSSNQISSTSLAQVGGNLTAAVPARTALATRLRMPFFLLPGDLLLLAPAYLFAPEWYMRLAVVAANGGLVPWQAGWATRIGRFQLVLGREVGVTFYGLFGGDRVIAPAAAAGTGTRILDFDSIGLDLPILEYRAYRSFAATQSSTVLFQLFTAVDLPTWSRVVAPPGAPEVDLHTVWSFGLRLVFDWRLYW